MISSDSERCPVCGTSKAGVLDDNCPICLMRLGGWEDRGQETGGRSQESGVRGQEAGTRRLGDYALIEEIARGGMGVVYRARQLSLNRMVAVKVLLAGHFANQTFIKRFRREAEAAASLSHPNIVSIYEVGEHEGQPYFSMELVEGQNLAELTRDKPLSAPRAAQLVKTIAETVHFAHKRGLLHRDLKPSNVLVDSLDVPHITDFGLAKHLSNSELETQNSELTLTGQVLGTPNYMPPEQADPKRGPTTAASDVYSLGAILYQLLTGRAPFMAETLTQTLRLVTECEPVMPRLLSPGVPRDLETICAKCLQKEPKHRYASAQELADELARFLRDEPIRARPVSAPARLMRWCRRKPSLAGSVGAGLVLLLFVAIASPIAVVRIEKERRHAEAARQQESGLRVRAEWAERQTEQQLYTALLEQARATVRSGELGHRLRALDALRRAAAISNSVELRREVFAALALPDLRFERELPFNPEVNLAQLDPSFDRIAICRGKGPVEIRAVSDYRLLATLPPRIDLPSYRRIWSADGRYLAVKRDYDARNGHWEIWELPDQLNNDKESPRCVLLLRDILHSGLSFHPRLPQLIASERTKGVALWNLTNGQELLRFPLVGKATILRFSPDGGRFASVSALKGEAFVAVHDSSDPDAEPLAGHSFKATLQTVSWHPAGGWLVMPAHSGAVHWMDAQTSEAGIVGTHKWDAVTATFSPDGSHLFTGGWEEDVICWDGRTRRREFTISQNSYTIQISADGSRCALIAKSGVRLFSFERPSAHREFDLDLGGRLRYAAFSANGRWLAASGGKFAGLWDLSCVTPGALNDKATQADLFFTSDGRELFASCNRPLPGSAFRWHIAPATNSGTAPQLTRLPLRNPPGLTSLALLSNSVVMTSTNGSQILTPDEMESASAHWTATIAGINGISPNGQWLGIHRPYSASLYLYQLPDLQRVAKLTHPAMFSDFQFSPLGDEVAIVSSRAGIEFWSTSNWQRTRLLTNFNRILYTRDGRGLWLSTDLRNAGLYNAQTLEPLLLLPAGMLPLAMSPDGRHVAVSIDERRLQLWDLDALREQFRALGLDWGKELSQTQTSKR